jgi:hypothetical protein
MRTRTSKSPVVGLVLLITSAACGSSSSNGAVAPDAGAPDAASAQDAGNDAADAAPDVDNGAPSTVYPAPHPALPQLVNPQNNPVLTSPKTHLVFYPNDPNEASLQTFAQRMATSTYWATTTSEYGVGPIAYGGTIDLTGQTPPTTIANTDIQTWVASEIQSGAFGTPDPQGIYTIVYPSSTTITETNPVSALLPPTDSCVAFGGYHDNASVTLGDAGAPTNFAYAVIPTCSGSVQDLTTAISHEWIEASTDPFLTASGAFTFAGGPDAAYFSVDGDHSVWALLGGGEAGDLCEPEGSDVYVTPSDLGFEVQRTWSNMLASASHDPCAPDLTATPFFDSAPVLDETVTFTSTLTGTVTSKGVTIPLGQSKTIEVDLFSDADTNGPWTVSASDLLSTYYGSYGLESTMSFAWDRTQGVNGEKLHLTITVTSASVVANAHAFMITSTQGARQTVWPGLVVE